MPSTFLAQFASWLPDTDDGRNGKVSVRIYTGFHCLHIVGSTCERSLFLDVSESCEGRHYCRFLGYLKRNSTCAATLQATCTQQGMVIMAACWLLDMYGGGVWPFRDFS